MRDNCSESKICQFYNEKSVFITGATGFMGKVNGLPELELKLKSTRVGAGRKASEKHQCEKDLGLDTAKEGAGNKIPPSGVDVIQII